MAKLEGKLPHPDHTTSSEPIPAAPPPPGAPTIPAPAGLVNPVDPDSDANSQNFASRGTPELAHGLLIDLNAPESTIARAAFEIVKAFDSKAKMEPDQKVPQTQEFAAAIGRRFAVDLPKKGMPRNFQALVDRLMVTLRNSVAPTVATPARDAQIAEAIDFLTGMSTGHSNCMRKVFGVKYLGDENDSDPTPEAIESALKFLEAYSAQRAAVLRESLPA